MINIIAFIVGLAVGHMVSTFLTNKRGFEVKIDKEGEKVTVEPIGRPKQKVEFLGEATEDEVKDIERPTGLKRFFSKFAKPPKEEEEEF